MEVERMWKEEVVGQPGICLEGLRKTTMNSKNIADLMVEM
jgi:hypothetical protein